MNEAFRAGCVAAAGLVLAACAAREVSAPVVDRAPGRSAQAQKPPVAQAAPALGAPSVPEGFYLVKRGDTLYSIALEHGADYREMAAWNSLDDPTRIRVGQLLRVKPPEERAAVQIAPARGTGRIEAKPLDSAPQARVEPAPARAEPAPAKSETAPAKPEPALARLEPAPARNDEGVEFIWPAKGRVIAGFAEPRSKGIDIDGKLGDPVVAAAPGRVTYIGTGIPGMGKLIVIKHDNGFITVYAHNKEIVVKEQQAVTRGQKIAELGSTDSERPKLHFQIRRGAAPVDPLRYLPAS